jgi:hypothetical protein
MILEPGFPRLTPDRASRFPHPVDPNGHCSTSPCQKQVKKNNKLETFHISKALMGDGKTGHATREEIR